MARHINYNKKTEERLKQEIKWLLEEKYGNKITAEANQDIEKIKNGEPVDYVIGRTDFCGAKIDLSLRPLIPRPETECWVAEAIDDIKSRGNIGEIKCLDLFSGSGCIGIAILKNIPEARVDFVDIDDIVLKQIAINLKLNGIHENRFSIIKSDIFENVSGAYDYIFANPPYIPTKYPVAQSAIEYEPHHSFLAGDSGLLFIKPFLDGSKKYLKSGGKLWMEFYAGERMEIENILQKNNYDFYFNELGDCGVLSAKLRAEKAYADPFFEYFDKEMPLINLNSSEWGTITYKEYPCSSKIILPNPAPLPTKTIEDVLCRRKTERNFSKKPLSKEILGRLLYFSAGLISKTVGAANEFRRFYPSGGARYPIEIYIANFTPGELDAGVYHYNVRNHILEKLSFSSAEKIKHALFYDFAKDAAALILLSFVGERTTKKYGNLGYKLGMIEAGHIGQNIYLVGTALGLGTLALGGMNYEVAQRELNLGEDETVFYQLAVGQPEENK
ncbi:MAG: HemK family protein methyltransferase [Parcubacteria group bacterium]|nr:HemK family protein methyltransferase [Parcubacteria group bacterium]